MSSIVFILIGLVLYAYVGYGLVVKILLSVIGKYKTATDPNHTPKVALIVPCFNEGDYVLNKVENSKALDYPETLLELIFISDGSDDQTADLLAQQSGIIHLHRDERQGKAAAMNRAVSHTEADILVFCDANTELNRSAIRLMVSHYADPKVGGVTGEKKISQATSSGVSEKGEGLYWKYESFLKQCDSDLYTVVGAAGELMSYRRNLYEPLESDTLLDDFMQSMRIVMKGYRVIYEKHAYATETASANVKEELKRKVRICAGGWQSMLRLKSALNPFFNWRVALAYISHRVLRWSLAAFALPLIFILSGLSAWSEQNPAMLLLFVAQLVFYTLALIGWQQEKQGRSSKLLYIPYYFSIMNLAVFLGFRRYLKGSQSALWERAKRA